jgi:FAD/FMN-containing dehydrogenase
MSAPPRSVPAMDHTTGRPWTNWGRNQTCTPSFTVRPRDEADVLDAVRFAIRAGLPVRAVGAGYSATPVVTTTGVLVNTDALSGITDLDSVRRRVRLRAGTRIKDIGEPLWDRGFSLPNEGDVGEPSIAGAIATATHGSGIHQTSMSAQLRWARIVTGHGEIVEVGEHDLNTLRAAQVAIGTLGIMTELELEVSSRFHLQEEITHPHWDEVAALAETHVAVDRHFSFLWCQSDDSPELYELPCPPGLPMANRAYQKVYREVPEPTSEPSAERRIDRAYRIFDAGGMSVPFHELEYCVPATRGMEAVVAMRDLISRHPRELYPLEVRWVKGDDAHLSPFHGRDSTVLSVSGAPGTDYLPYLRDVDALLDGFDARPHWGKLHFLTRDRLAARYPGFDDFVAVRRAFDPHGVFLNDGLRELLE